jgi:hypothetical protein
MLGVRLVRLPLNSNFERFYTRQLTTDDLLLCFRQKGREYVRLDYTVLE